MPNPSFHCIRSMRLRLCVAILRVRTCIEWCTNPGVEYWSRFVRYTGSRASRSDNRNQPGKREKSERRLSTGGHGTSEVPSLDSSALIIWVILPDWPGEIVSLGFWQFTIGQSLMVNRRIHSQRSSLIHILSTLTDFVSVIPFSTESRVKPKIQCSFDPQRPQKRWKCIPSLLKNLVNSAFLR
jgi:hypothetical protein